MARPLDYYRQVYPPASSQFSTRGRGGGVDKSDAGEAGLDNALLTEAGEFIITEDGHFIILD